MVSIQRIACASVLHEGRTVMDDISHDKQEIMGGEQSHSERLIMEWRALMFSPEFKVNMVQELGLRARSNVKKNSDSAIWSVAGLLVLYELPL